MHSKSALYTKNASQTQQNDFLKFDPELEF